MSIEEFITDQIEAGKTLNQIAKMMTPTVIDGCLVLNQTIIFADDGNNEVEYSGLTHNEAAQQYVDEGDYGVGHQTVYIAVSTYRYGYDDEGDLVQCDEERHTIEIDPPEPPCESDSADEDHNGQHDWLPYSLNGHGGGAISKHICRHCGMWKISRHQPKPLRPIM